MKRFSFVLALILTQNLHAQSVDAVLKKHVAFIGGEKNWRKIKTIVSAGEYNYGGIKFPFQSFSKAPDLYKFIVPFQGKYYAQAFDGTSGWKIDAFKDETTPTLLTGSSAHALANEADVELENQFIRYKEKGHKALLEKADTTIQNNICIKILFTRKSGKKETYYFNAKTFALVMKKAGSKNSELGGAILTTYYSDFRNVDGIKIPFQTEIYHTEQPILIISVDSVQINSDIDDSIFKL